MRILLKRQKVNLEVNNVNFWRSLRGLMFCSKKTDNLLFDFGKSVRIRFHSLFVFFNFLLIWLDSENKVLGYKIVRPFTFSIIPDFRFHKVLEVPINERNEMIFRFFRRKKGKV